MHCTNLLRFSSLWFALSLLASFEATAQRAYAITNVSVIPMDREVVLHDQTVLIKDGFIEKIGGAGAIRFGNDYTVINGSQKFLIPGLFDMHTHFFYEQGENKNTCKEELEMMLANGLTTVRIECGDPAYLEARNKVANHEWAGPRVFVASPQFVGAWPWPAPVFAAICKTPADAEAAVRKFKLMGYDEIKITFMVKRDVYDAIIRTAREVGMNVTGHVGPLVKLPAALEAKEQIEHMDEFIDQLLPDTSYNHGQSVSDMNIWRKRAWETVPYLDEKKIPELVKNVKDAGIYVTPTNFFFFSCFGESISDDQYRARPDYAFIPSVIKKERWEIKERYWKNSPPESSRKKYMDIRKKMTYSLWRAGVPLMAGSDSPEWFLVQGFSLHDELETFVKAGLSPFAALQTATINPAMYLALDKTVGTITAGKTADLILLDKNPLDDIRNTRSIREVFKDGDRHSNATIEKMLEDARGIGN